MLHDYCKGCTESCDEAKRDELQSHNGCDPCDNCSNVGESGSQCFTCTRPEFRNYKPL